MREQEVFFLFDEGKGSVSRENVCHVIRILGYNPTLKELEDCLGKVEGNPDRFSWDNFSLIILPSLKQMLSREKLEFHHNFSVLDEENIGSISLQEMRTVFTSKETGEALSHEEMSKFFKSINVSEMEDGRTPLYALHTIMANLDMNVEKLRQQSK